MFKWIRRNICCCIPIRQDKKAITSKEKNKKKKILILIKIKRIKNQVHLILKILTIYNILLIKKHSFSYHKLDLRKL